MVAVDKAYKHPDLNPANFSRPEFSLSDVDSYGTTSSFKGICGVQAATFLKDPNKGLLVEDVRNAAKGNLSSFMVLSHGRAEADVGASIAPPSATQTLGAQTSKPVPTK